MMRLLILIIVMLGLAVSGCTSRIGRRHSTDAGQAGVVAGSSIKEFEERSFQEKLDIQQEIIRLQETEIQRLEGELELMRRQQWHNEALRERAR